MARSLTRTWALERYYYGARYYDPQIGRFMTPDPINDDWTPYSYVRNNPIMNNDPTGMTSDNGGNSEISYYVGEPCAGFDRQAQDQFNSWALADAGKRQIPRWARHQYGLEK